MKRRRMAALILAGWTILAVATSCGESPDVVASAEGESSAESTTTSTAPPLPSVEPGQVARTPDPQLERVEVNLNTADGGLGGLCWSRWEVGRRYLQMTVVHLEDTAAADEAARGFAATLPTVSETLGAVNTDDAAIDRFTSQFVESIDAAIVQLRESPSPEQIRRVATGLFDFEKYPGVREYMDAARGVCATA